MDEGLITEKAQIGHYANLYENNSYGHLCCKMFKDSLMYCFLLRDMASTGHKNTFKVLQP